MHQLARQLYIRSERSETVYKAQSDIFSKKKCRGLSGVNKGLNHMSEAVLETFSRLDLCGSNSMFKIDQIQRSCGAR